MVESLSISELAKQCRREADRFQQSGQSDEIYCLELFRRALAMHDEAAWQAIYSQYHALVITWVHGYSRFHQTAEEVDFFVNAALTRLWRSGAKPETAANLDTLGKCLRYLKLCVASSIEDHLRREDRDALKHQISLEKQKDVASAERDIDRAVSLAALRQAVWETVQNEKERLVAAESWVYGLNPRTIQAEHPTHFANVAEVSQIKRNLIKRLKRRLVKAGRADG